MLLEAMLLEAMLLDFPFDPHRGLHLDGKEMGVTQGARPNSSVPEGFIPRGGERRTGQPARAMLAKRTIGKVQAPKGTRAAPPSM
jgi:hypothetical protein